MATSKKKKVLRTSSTKTKVLAGRKKRFNFSKKQRNIIGIAAVILITVVTYLGVQYYQDTKAEAATCASKTYKPGGNNTCIKYFQQMMIATDKSLANTVKANGRLDSNTKKAVTAFQKTNGLTASGTINPVTWKKICTLAETKARDAYNRAGCAITMAKYTRIATIKGCGTMQGGTTDGTYLYFACTEPRGKNDVNINVVKYSTSGKKIDSSEAHGKVYHRAQLGHVGGIAYDQATKQLVISIWDDDTPGNNGIKNKVRFMNPKTFEISNVISSTSSRAIRDICHKPNSNEYVSRGSLYTLDTVNNIKQLTYKKQLYDNGAVDDEIGITYEKTVKYKDAKGKVQTTNIIENQSIACDSTYIYILRVIYRQTGYNVIAVYDWNGENVSAYRIDLNDEAENVSVINGALYMGINEGGESKGGKSANDYFIKLKSISFK
ncbi:MAG: peptidoglycan-binding domain-containing protein [Candidatus Saccharimonas sp.]